MDFGLQDKNCIKDIPEFGLNNLVEPNLSVDDNYLDELMDLVPLKDMKMLRMLTVSLADCEKLAFEDASFPTLTKLTFVCYNNCISIEWFLSLFPSLEDLDIMTRKGIKSGGVKLLVEKKYPNLRTIHTHYSTVHPSFYTFIEHAAENLKILSVSSYFCDASNEKDHPIDLTGLKLKRFHLQMYSEDTCNQGIVAHVIIGGTSQTFIFFCPGDVVLVCPDEDVYEKTLIIATTSITYDAIDDFEINSKAIQKFGRKLLCG